MTYDACHSRYVASRSGTYLDEEARSSTKRHVCMYLHEEARMHVTPRRGTYLGEEACSFTERGAVMIAYLWQDVLMHTHFCFWHFLKEFLFCIVVGFLCIVLSLRPACLVYTISFSCTINSLFCKIIGFCYMIYAVPISYIIQLFVYDWQFCTIFGLCYICLCVCV
jgi:hypothetical protein